MDNRAVRNSSVLLAVTLMLILVSSAGTSAYASGLSGYSGKAPLVEHHKPDHDKGGGNGSAAAGDIDKEKSKEKKNNGKRDIFGPASMFQPVPSALDDFELTAEGFAMAKRDGRDGPLTDAEIELRATVIREEGNHFRFYATGTVDIDDGDEYDIVDAQGIIIFFKNPRGNSIAGLLHIVGKNVVDESGNELGKFRLRALVMDDPENDTWRIVVFPSGKLGENILLVNMAGSIGGVAGGEPPAPGSSSLDHFVVSSIPNVGAGSMFNVTVTAHMSNGTLLKSYEARAKITDTTGTAKPLLTARFQDGVFKGTLNITKAASSAKVKFTDVGTGKSGESNSFAVLGGTLAEVILTPSSANVVPGAKAQFEAKGTDRFGNELTGITFVWALSSNDHGSISTAGSKANFTAASSISNNAKVNLTASAGGRSDLSQISISPSSSMVLDHFVLGNISSPQTAGVPFQIQVTAVNSTGATLTGYAGPMRLTDSTGTLNMTVASGLVNGVWVGSANITEAGDKVRITAADVASGDDGRSNEFAVVAGALDHFDFNQIDNQTAGEQFNMQVTARDAFGNLVTNHQGNVTLGTNDGASPNGNSTLFAPASHNFTAGDEGRHTFAATMYNAKENVTITATGSGKSGESNQFDVSPAAVAKINVSPTSATVSPGGMATFSSQALDPYGNPVSGADLQWSLDSDALGDIDELTATTAEFTASSGISATTSGSVSAKVGAVTGSASITVQV